MLELLPPTLVERQRCGCASNSTHMASETWPTHLEQTSKPTGTSKAAEGDESHPVFGSKPEINVPSSSDSNSLAVRASELTLIFRSPKLARRIVAAGWLKPSFRAHRCVLYDRGDVNAAWERIKGGEEPPRLELGD